MEKTTSNYLITVIDEDCSNGRVAKETEVLVEEVQVSTAAVRCLDAAKVSGVALWIVLWRCTSSFGVITGKQLDLNGVVAW